MAGIFISYRREDAAGWAGRLSADLSAGFRHAKIFMDIDAIPPGVNYDEYIAQAVGSCDVLIALIGPHWLTVADKTGRRRLDNTDDFTRIEIAAALRRNIRVIPALVGGAEVPAMEDLPVDLKPLARRQAYELADHRWADDCKRLIAALRPIVQTKDRTFYKVASSLGLALLLGLAGYSAKAWYDHYLESKAHQPEVKHSEETRIAEQTRSQEEARKAEATRIAEEARQAEVRRAAREREQERQKAAQDTAAAGKQRLVDARNTAVAACNAALGWQRRVDESAQTANRHADTAQSAATAASNVRFPSAAKSAVSAARMKAAAAREAALRAGSMAKTAQEAVATARIKADAATNATDPSIAAVAANDAIIAEGTAKTAASNAINEVDAARAAALAAVEAKDQVLAIVKARISGGVNKGSGAPPVARRPSRNEIRNFRAENISDSELKVMVDYTYVGDKGSDPNKIAIEACSVQPDGRQTPGTACVIVRMAVGDGTAPIRIKFFSATGTYQSSAVRVCMRGPSTDPAKYRGETFYCETFPFAKLWRR